MATRRQFVTRIAQLLVSDEFKKFASPRAQASILVGEFERYIAESAAQRAEQELFESEEE